MKVDKEKCKQLAEQRKQEIVDTIKDITENYKTNPDLIAEFLAFSSRFYKYSTNNRILIEKQNPNAILCSSYVGWKEKGYSIKSGERAIKILIPTPKLFLKSGDSLVAFQEASDELKKAYAAKKIEAIKMMYYKVGNIFDIGQTDCPLSDYPKLLGVGYKDARQAKIYEGLKEFSMEELNCFVKETSLSSVTLHGQYMPFSNTIDINEVLDDSGKVSVLSHELGHAILHNSSSFGQKSEAQMKFEADAICILISNYFDIQIEHNTKSHLSNHFSCLKAEIEGKYGVGAVDFNKMLAPVFTEFVGNINNIVRCVNKHLDEKQLSPQKAFERDMPQQQHNGFVNIKNDFERER